MPTNTSLETDSRARRWAGLILTALLVLFLGFDAFAKILRAAPVLKANAGLGLAESTVAPIGFVLLACTVLYAVPRTSIFGAVLLTAYLGGAVAIQVRANGGAFPIVFSIGVGLMVWLALVLREPRLGWLIALRRW
ncbi:MAG TPA: DoxX family protein [Candidatus Didemnitutus sp.]|nr:DoxX family protein [Candidatus Didemnitutus sp.]